MRVPTVFAAVISLGFSAVFISAAELRETGTPPHTETSAWMQLVLRHWEEVCRRHLRVPLEPLPWIIYYDAEHAWHLAPTHRMLPAHSRTEVSLTFNEQPRPLIWVPHDNKSLWVPERRLPIGPDRPPHNFAMPYEGGLKTFFVFALPSVVRALPGGTEFKDLETHFLGYAIHELAHTRQLVDVMRRITRLRERHHVPRGINDNFIEDSYGSNPEYRGLFDEERDKYFRAAFEDDVEVSRPFLRQALEITKRRRARFFVAEKSIHAELDDIFLGLEGVAEWSRFQVMRTLAPTDEPWQGTVQRVTARVEAWSQLQGLALFLLIDRYVPNWQSRFLAADFPSPFTVLREAQVRK